MPGETTGTAMLDPPRPPSPWFTVILGLFAVYGGWSLGARFADGTVSDAIAALWRDPPALPLRPSRLPLSVAVATPRDQPQQFVLDAPDAITMTGRDDPEQERWADILGNFYTGRFVRNFSYRDPHRTVRLRIVPSGPTFAGRIEVRNLKPNFIYQLKLMGDYRADPDAFERIGYTGRWRLPGRGTNYTDRQVRDFADKAAVKAYIYFDYILTDADGHATRDFALDQSLHVTWLKRQRDDHVPDEHLHPVTIDASDPAVYARPKSGPARAWVWTERERVRYTGSPIRLPPGRYRAALALTEESLHASDADGGWWATVYHAPVSFTITAPPAAAPVTP